MKTDIITEAKMGHFKKLIILKLLSYKVTIKDPWP